MAADGVAGTRGPRVGLVLGSGGVLGAAWMVGALVAVQERLGFEAGDAELVVGTSAGSVLTAALRCGVNVDEMVAHQRGGVSGRLAAFGPPDLGSRGLPPPPLLRVGSPRLMLAAMRAPHRMHPGVAMSALLPQGRARHSVLHAMVHTMASHAWPHLPPPHGRPAEHGGHRGLAGVTQSGPPETVTAVDAVAALDSVDSVGAVDRVAAVDAALGAIGALGAGESGSPAVTTEADHVDGEAGFEWARDGRTWIVAVDYYSGRRVVFGQAGAPPAALPDAVVASCSIPCWYRPMVINGRRYVDGGLRSATSAGLLASEGLDEVYVLAPMASMVTDRPRLPHERLERHVRRLLTLGLRREVARLRSAGTAVTVLTPGPEDLAAIGANMMDPRRRRSVLETSLRTSAAALTGVAEVPPPSGHTHAA